MSLGFEVNVLENICQEKFTKPKNHIPRVCVWVLFSWLIGFLFYFVDFCNFFSLNCEIRHLGKGLQEIIYHCSCVSGSLVYTLTQFRLLNL